jgi:exopolysaccharide production protein ExoZ
MAYLQYKSDGTARIYLIQYLRALATIMVVFYNARNSWELSVDPLSPFNMAQAGIDLFFVISGFIMVHVMGDAKPDEFVIRRIIRVVPLYWMATALAILKDAAAGSTYRPAEVLMSLLFLPFPHGGESMGFFPIVASGWTLNYEMAFYLVFAMALGLRGIGAWLIPMSMLAFGAAAIGVALAGETIKAFYFDPIVLEFVAGAMLALLYRYAGSRWTAVFVAALPVGVALFFLLPGEWPRLLRWGMPMTLILLGTVYLERHVGQLRLRPLLLLGNASYAICLSHALFIGALAHVAATAFGHNLPGFFVFMAAAVGASIVVGCMVHLYVETPVIWWLKGGAGGELQPSANQRSRRKI